ncbi:mucosal addressin cell adhesion molecule 1-like [Boleophthalmus pectinirostris]|uniref:mucosal addressin cell adhesion molecule 1-like n=1 Tax=Boleophthalmus pectinirostris TaxID=150288 RepID=UPI00242C61C1|nr:mucosal addressin cell adhesion molecule 1-like [Boleophthalmus pectinirostris]
MPRRGPAGACRRRGVELKVCVSQGPRLLQAPGPSGPQTTGHPDPRTPRPPDTQTSRHPDLQTPRPPDTQTSRPPDTQTPRPPDLQHRTSHLTPSHQQTLTH